jgi:hypothetical protein
VQVQLKSEQTILPLLDAQQGFELRLVDERFSGTGEAQYSLVLAKTDDGRQAVEIYVDAQALSRASVELAFPVKQFSVAEGEYGVWPDAGDQLSHKLDLDQPGVLRYKAQLKSETSPGATGKFKLLRVVLAPRQA